MQYSFTRSCLLALVSITSVVFAQTAGFDVFTSPTPNESIAAGSNFTIKWTPSPNEGTVSIFLLEGSSNTTLQIGPQIATSIPSSQGSFDWSVSATTVTAAVYGLKIQLDSDPNTFQYSSPFSITGTSGTTAGTGGTTTIKVSQISTLPSTTTSSSSSSSATISSSPLLFVNTTAQFTGQTTPTSTALTSGSGVSTPSGTASSAVVKPTSGVMSNAVVAGTGLLSALMLCLGMLL